MPSSAIAPPMTYAEWAVILDLFKNKEDDETVLHAMRNGSIEWQSGVAERFSKKLIEAVNFRMDKAVDRFQRDIGRAHGQEREVVQSMLSLRRELALLVRALDLPALPEKDREHYRALVYDQASKIQSSLEDSAKRDRTGRLANIVRNNRVNSI